MQKASDISNKQMFWANVKVAPVASLELFEYHSKKDLGMLWHLCLGFFARKLPQVWGLGEESTLPYHPAAGLFLSI